MKRQDLETRQARTALGVCMYQKSEVGKRLDATRKLFGRKVLAVDPHSHSIHSDGCTTVDDNYENAIRRARLDFLFCTDHSTTKQKRSTKKLPYAEAGMESHSGGYHVGLIGLSGRHVPREKLEDGMESARRVADFAWVAHPVGFNLAVTDEIVERAFVDLYPVRNVAFEVLNGFAWFGRAYPQTGKGGTALLDRLLCAGKRVTPVGASDAHGPLEIGNAWTGVFAPHRSAASIIKALNAGHCFASELPLLDFSCNGKPMGSDVDTPKGSRLTFRIRAADAGGLAWVRIISGGRALKEYRVREKPVFEAELTKTASSRPAYYRVEVVAVDDRRACSAPVYVGKTKI
jgi:hypothetical protein